MESYYPFVILAVGLVIVIGGIVALRINAFLSLLIAAMVVSLMAPGAWAEKVSRVTTAFGNTAAGVGIVIALAAIIGKTMMDSGAADRIVNATLALFGEKRAAGAVMASSFTLAIPVFFDTVFYLIVPLARSLHRQTGKGYLKYLLAVTAAASAHALVPPTPGPLAVANELNVNIGLMIIVGIAVGAPASMVSLFIGNWLNRKMPVEPPVVDGSIANTDTHADSDQPLPSLWLSLAPVILPVLLIATNTIAVAGSTTNEPHATAESNAVAVEAAIVDATESQEAVNDAQPVEESSQGEIEKRTVFRQVMSVLGNPNMALLISCAISMLTYYSSRKPTKSQFANSMEQALTSGGMIILITAAGGAFGAMLKAAELAPAIKDAFGDSSASGLGLLLLAFGIASLVKFAQGSSTTAMLVTAGMMSAMIGELEFSFHPVYLATAIGSGSLVGSWMNDSGFWIFSKMGGLTELQTLKTWTPLLAILGLISMAMTLLLASVLPLV